MKVSIIIPALNEAENILAAIESVKRQAGDFEIIVVDGGSDDDTLELAQLYAATISSERGRARQMNAGARQATGDVLLFLHADSILHPNALSQLRSTLRDDRIAGGTFTLAFDADNFWLRFYTFFPRFHFVFFHYGDQGIYVRRSIFEQMGGFSDIPLMEDIDFLRRLQRLGKRTVIRHYPVMTSARRFFKYGLVWQEVLNIALVIAWILGVKPERLARWYAVWKADGEVERRRD
jgi:rSAM/selenodomain-associated transferase 2